MRACARVRFLLPFTCIPELAVLEDGGDDQQASHHIHYRGKDQHAGQHRNHPARPRVRRRLPVFFPALGQRGGEGRSPPPPARCSSSGSHSPAFRSSPSALRELHSLSCPAAAAAAAFSSHWKEALRSGHLAPLARPSKAPLRRSPPRQGF